MEPMSQAQAWAVLECARGQGVRTRLDGRGGSVVVRSLPAGVVYPYNYGYVEGTRAEDGEELDVFVLGPSRPPATRLRVEVVGAVAFADRRGDDPKLLAVPAGWAGREPVAAAAARVAEFLRRYKDDAEPRRVGGAVGQEAALSLLAAARRRGGGEA